MAQDDRNAGGNLPVAGLVALVLFASGLWVQHQPLQTDRPGVELRQQRELSAQQDVEARLWQDPLEAVKRAETSSEKGAGTSWAKSAVEEDRRKPESLRRWIGQYPKKQRLVMPVMIFGGPYAEDAEARRRSRYAVLSGLREARFTPDNSRTIGYVRLQPSTRDSPKLLIAFEKWERPKSATTRWEEVYLLWIAEESLGEQPLKQLDALLAQILPANDPNIELTVLGPASHRMSTQLAAQWDTLAASQPSRAVASDRFELGMQGRQVWFLAPHLSTPTATLVRQIAKRTASKQENLAERNRLEQTLAKPLRSLRLGPDDRQLARLLLDELANRGIKLPTAGSCECDDQVALLVEADTYYARSLGAEFRRMLKACSEHGFKPMVFHYFRGLDGKVAQDASDAKKSGDSTSDKSKQEFTPLQERAQGQGQFDYLRRIADEIRQLSDAQESALRHEEENGDEDDGKQNNSKKKCTPSPGQRPSSHRGAVRAVIVVGSDIHDKLAILHALRESLPHTLFATTDLDAGLLQKEQLPWTRNVIVASGFDFKLPPALQEGAPPFRDTYQTATYLATRKALADPGASADADLMARIDVESRQARLFEVGNQGAVALSYMRTDPPGQSIKDGGARGQGGRSWGVWLLAAALLGVLGLAISWCLRQLLIDLFQRKSGAIISVGGATAALAFLIGVMGYIATIAARPGEEPLSWFGGISIWPSMLFRTTAGVLAIAMLFYGIQKLKKGDQAIESEFFDSRTNEAHAAQSPGGSRSGFQESWFPSAGDEHQPKSAHARDVWRQYKDWTRGYRCCIRVLLGAAAVYGLSLALLSYLGTPQTPVRGAASSQLYNMTFAPSLILTIVLLVWTLDRVALCSLFLHRLYGTNDVPQRSDWSAAVQKRFCGYCAVAPAQPGGPANAVDDQEAAQSYIDLRISARITRHVGGIIIYPFMVCLLLIVARSRYFDNWDASLGLLAVLLMILGLVAVGAFTLRQNAERIRRYTVDQLEALEIRLRSKNYETNILATAEQVALMKAIARNITEGTFASFASQPIVRALLLPFGGAGLINLLDFVLI